MVWRKRSRCFVDWLRRRRQRLRGQPVKHVRREPANFHNHYYQLCQNYQYSLNHYRVTGPTRPN